MFSCANIFNSDISDWDVSNVINMKYMFYCAYAFNSDISSWNISNVRNMSYMFFVQIRLILIGVICFLVLIFKMLLI